MTTLFVPRERRSGETRVAATPETVKRLVKDGFDVRVEHDAGASAFFPDAEYASAGASLTAFDDAWPTADVVVTVGPLDAIHARTMKQGATLIGLLAPHRSDEATRALAERRVSSFALELLPRTTRAQSMDALSSQASIAGYKAVILAAERLGKYLPMLMTAAGTVRPARVVVLGAGVAGLQAIATAKRLGAVVEVSDVRAAAKQDAESLGAKFIEIPLAESADGKGGYAREMTKADLDRQRELVGERIAGANAVVTTALVPGRPAPKLIPASVVARMRPGSIIVDLAAAEGGNCELTRPGEDVVEQGVLIVGQPNLAATVPMDASLLYARNCLALIQAISKAGAIAIDTSDDVVDGTLLTHEGKIHHAPTRERLEASAAPPPTPMAERAQELR
ncbi:MAG: Re/Si-specific NAD(P)(+) transhydrogenase subunit alpha [Sandaracinus sp.]